MNKSASKIAFPPFHQMVPPARPQSTTQSVTSSHAMARQGSNEATISRKGSTDSSALPSTALPSTASWAKGGNQATPSPQMAHSQLQQSQLPSQKTEYAKSKESTPANTPPNISETPVTEAASAPQPVPKSTAMQVNPMQKLMNGLIKSVTSPDFRFVFDDSCLNPEERAIVHSMPKMIDPYGGAKRRLVQDREAAEQARLEADMKSKAEAQAQAVAEDVVEEDSAMATGSLALGGEPEDNPRTTSARGAIGRPQANLDTNMADQLANLSVNGRSITPQQRQQSGLPNTGSIPSAPGLPQPPSQNAAFDMSDFDRRAPQYSQAQYDQISNHQRNGSRYFNNDSKTSTSRFQGQQQSFYSSGIQGPPPGLPTSGTPPVSGGGMFAHGQNFTNPGFGNSKDASADSHIRGRSGTNAGHDMSKRELLLSLQSNPLRSPPLPAPAPGLLNPLYGQYPGAYQDPGLVKQRKKGKKHRHANTSSSGGGVEHLADPSIVQARIHQGSNNGQGLFGGNQGGYNQSNLMYGGGYNRW